MWQTAHSRGGRASIHRSSNPAGAGDITARLLTGKDTAEGQKLSDEHLDIADPMQAFGVAGGVMWSLAKNVMSREAPSTVSPAGLVAT